MTEAREIGRVYMNAASDVVASIADHSRKTMHWPATTRCGHLHILPDLQAPKLQWKRSRFQTRIIEIR